MSAARNSTARMYRVFLALSALLAVGVPERGSADAGPAPVPPSPASFAAYSRSGSHDIEGYLLADTQEFGPMRFAGISVSLMPYSEYAYWYVRKVGSLLSEGSEEELSFSPPLRRFTRVVQTNSSGYFIFRNLPPGNYLLFAVVRKDDYETPAEIRRETAVTESGDYVSVPFRTHGLHVKAESDAVGATVTVVPDARGYTISRFDVLGRMTCCSEHL